jgi:uncharacterized metal-binding protein YceD (DUF177 family)
VSEFSRMIDRRHLKGAPEELLATADECAALAQRFGLVKIRRLGAKLALVADGEAVDAKGTMEADFVQACAISGDDLPVRLNEQVTFRFVPEQTAPGPEDEIELGDAILDEIEYSGTSFDLGEAVAQSLALAIDPYAVGPEAEVVRAKHGLSDEGPKGALAEALAKLKKD